MQVVWASDADDDQLAWLSLVHHLGLTTQVKTQASSQAAKESTAAVWQAFAVTSSTTACKFVEGQQSLSK